MGQHLAAVARPLKTESVRRFVFRNNGDANKFVRLADANLKLLFPEVENNSLDFDNMLRGVTEMANNARHSFRKDPEKEVTLALERNGERLIATMQGAPFQELEIKPPDDRTAEHGWGLWLTSVDARASGGWLEVDWKAGKIELRYVVGTDERILKQRAEGISGRETAFFDKAMAEKRMG